MWSLASSGVMPWGTSPVTTTTSASQSQPQASSASGIGERGGKHLVGAALVHERIGPEALRHLGGAGLPDQSDVVHIGRAVRPLIGARQRRQRLALVEAVAGDDAMLEIHGEQLELGREPVPIVERGLKRRGDMGRVGAPGEVVRDHHQPPVAAAFKEPSFIELPVIPAKAGIHEHRRARCPPSVFMGPGSSPR